MKSIMVNIKGGRQYKLLAIKAEPSLLFLMDYVNTKVLYYIDTEAVFERVM